MQICQEIFMDISKPDRMWLHLYDTHARSLRQGHYTVCPRFSAEQATCLSQQEWICVKNSRSENWLTWGGEHNSTEIPSFYLTKLPLQQILGDLGYSHKIVKKPMDGFLQGSDNLLGHAVETGQKM